MTDHDEIEIRHATGACARLVERWFKGDLHDDLPERPILDGDRALLFPHPVKPSMFLKIKGAGFRGGPVDFSRRHLANNPHPVFDFDGQMMEDRASSHDGAWLGGMSFQQAATEYAVTQQLVSMGERTVPCLGYGRIIRGAAESWFTIHEVERDWRLMRVPLVPIESVAQAALECGRIQRRMIEERGLVGYSWMLGPPGGPFYVKDLHPFRRADPLSMSRVSWTMHVIHSMHIPCYSMIYYSLAEKIDMLPDMQAFPFRAWLPDATQQDHDALRFKIVAHYMRGTPQDFDPIKLRDLLHSNRISRAILEACPKDYVHAN